MGNPEIFRFLDLPPELRLMLYEQITDLHPTLNICKQIRGEATLKILPKLRLHLHCGISGDKDKLPWFVSITPVAAKSKQEDCCDVIKNIPPPSMYWEVFRESYMAKLLDGFHHVCIFTSALSSIYGSQPIHVFVHRSRDGHTYGMIGCLDRVRFRADRRYRAMKLLQARREDRVHGGGFLEDVVLVLCQERKVLDKCRPEEDTLVWVERVHEHVQGTIIELDR